MSKTLILSKDYEQMNYKEEKRFHQSLKEYKEGKTKSLGQIKKDLGL